MPRAVLVRRLCALGVAFLSTSGFVSVASGAVTQPPPDSTPLPQPVPSAETQLVTARGFMASALTLSGLFAFRNDAVDPMNDAVADPGTFRPLCPGTVNAEFVLHGGGCNLALAWYNATGTAPAANQLHALVPNNVAMEMQCQMDFCPLAGSSMLPNTSWMTRSYGVNVCNDASYAGGAIGFALIGDAATRCSQTKYSERAANVACTACTPAATWVTALVYPSRSRANSYYLAFEDLPMAAEGWRDGASDGDFNDFVYQLSGVCHGNCGAGGAGGMAGMGGMTTGGTTSTGGTAGMGGTTTGGTATGGTTATGGADTGGTSSGGTSEPTGGAGAVSGAGGEGATVTGGASGTDGTGDTTSTGGTDGTGTCVPGRQLECACSDGAQGSQRCVPNGEGFEPCVCAPAADRKDIVTESGCGCRHGGRTSGGASAFALAFLIALRRRSARRRSEG
jgi:hypothetical protein